MRRFRLAAGVLAAAAVVAAPAGTAYAGPPVTGKTQVTGSPTAGQPLDIQVTLYGVYPIVPYDFSLENRCWFSGRYAGPASSRETYPLLGPWYAAGSGSTSAQTIDLTVAPSGAACVVRIIRGTSPVKGSDTAYTVG